MSKITVKQVANHLNKQLIGSADHIFNGEKCGIFGTNHEPYKTVIEVLNKLELEIKIISILCDGDQRIIGFYSEQSESIDEYDITSILNNDKKVDENSLKFLNEILGFGQENGIQRCFVEVSKKDYNKNYTLFIV